MKHSAKEISLPNGVKGLVLNVPSASVMSLYINFRAGEFMMPEDKWETPHIMEHLVLGANKAFPKARDFQAEFEKNGAYSNASTDAYDITYEAECADFEWKRILDCMVSAITQPLFLRTEFDAEVGNVREELSSRSNDHFRQLSLSLRKAYGFHATTYQERLKLMKNVSLADISKHYQATHHSSNLRFIICGNINPGRMKHIKSVLGSINLEKGGGRKKVPNEHPTGMTKPLFIKNDTVDNFYFYLDTFTHQRFSDENLYAMSLLNSILSETLHSRIWGKAREQGLLYGMSSNISYGHAYTNWWFGAQVRPDNANKVMQIIVDELRQVLQGKLSSDEIDAAKQYRIGRFQRSAQTVSGIAHGYMGRYFYEDFVEDFYETPRHIRAVTKKQIVDSAAELFSEKQWGFGVLGGTDKTPVKALYEQVSVLW